MERQRVSPTPGSGRPPPLPRAPLRRRAGHPPAPSQPDPARTPPGAPSPPTCQSQPQHPAVRAPGGGGRAAARVSGAGPSRAGAGSAARPPPPRQRMAASGSPGPPPSPCPGEARRASPPPAPRSGKAENELTSERSRRRRLRAGGSPGAEQVPAQRRRLPQCPPPHCFPSERIPAKPSPGTRKFPGATPPAAAMETGPRLPERLARDPASEPPAPPASRAAANRRRCGRGRRHLGAARAAPSRRHVRAAPACSRWPRGRAARAAGCWRRFPGSVARSGPPDPEGGRERNGPGGTGELGPGAGLRVIVRKRQASAGVHWQVAGWLRPGVRSAEQWPRAMGSAARLPRVSFLALLPTSCQSLDTLIFCMPQFLYL